MLPILARDVPGILSQLVREAFDRHPWRAAALVRMLEAMAFRPCCGNCRGEDLEVIEEQGAFRRPVDTMRSHTWRCRDCGAHWDGAQLTAEEIADRPTRPPPPDPNCPMAEPGSPERAD